MVDPPGDRAGARGASKRSPRATQARVAPARSCAYAVLRRVFEQDAYADRALQAEAEGLDTRDRALAMRLAYGAVQRKGTLDHLIELFAERSPRRLDAPVLAALRLGLYELSYLRGAPDHAVVADTVELAKEHARAGHGLVNAVLRRAGREGRGVLEGLDEKTPAQAAIKHSHPLWISQLWWQELGEHDARALMAFDNEPGEVALRANTLVTDAPTLARELAAGDPRSDVPAASTHADPHIPEALVLEDALDVRASRAWREGACIAQSRAAMLVAHILAPLPGERVLDLCAAPGGKSTHLAALMDGSGEVLAVERDRRRAGALARTAQRLRAENVRVELGDAARPRPEGAVFDRVLVDPPCSGLGTLQARPDLRWRMTPARLAELERAQGEILRASASAVRPGGVLVYSTCTLSPTENERRIAAFLAEHPEFALDDLRAEPVARGRTSARMPEAVLTLPHRDRTAGFFIARLRRED
jgi:16S rRNA (cytosine967-C5)-methyltransferase